MNPKNSSFHSPLSFFQREGAGVSLRTDIMEGVCYANGSLFLFL